LGRKSSKRCCIFHKQREFGESSTESSEDDSDYDGNASFSSSSSKESSSRPPPPPQLPPRTQTRSRFSSHKKRQVIARKKNKKPDYQRFHAWLFHISLHRWNLFVYLFTDERKNETILHCFLKIIRFFDDSSMEHLKWNETIEYKICIYI